jgi:single-strand DNA-binding protein
MLITGVARLGRDGELRFIPSGMAVINLALAFNYGRKQDDGDRPTQWIDCALFGKQAEALAPYLKKGGQVSVTAQDPHIEYYNKGDGSQGVKLAATVVNIELVGGKREGGEGQQSTQQRPAQNAPRDNFDEPFDDSIPF